MSALILKDFYVLWRQARYFLILILVFSAIPGSFNATFAVVYTAMLPYTAMAYDERSKWDQLAATMPYSHRDLVLSKYLFGWLAAGAAVCISLLLQSVISVVFHLSVTFSPTVSLLAFCTSLCILALTLPLMFRFGVEKARLVMFLTIFLVCGAAGMMGSLEEAAANSGLLFPVLVTTGLPAAALVLTAISIPLSICLFKKREG